jgi:serine/threonine protein kinase
LAENVTNYSKYAIKVIDISSSFRKQTADKEEEIDRSIKINSPYLIRYFNTFIYNSKKCIVMEYCAHKDLEATIETCLKYSLTISEEVCIYLFIIIKFSASFAYSFTAYYWDIYIA